MDYEAIKNQFDIIREGKRVLLMYSAPDFCDNAYFLYEYIKSKSDKYVFIWLVEDYQKFSNTDDTIFITVTENNYPTMLDMFLKYVDVTLATHNSSEYSYLRYNSNHKIINLTHGCGGKGVKIVRAHKQPGWPGCLFDYIVSLGGVLSNQYMRKHFLLKNDDKLIDVGYPRNDILFSTKNISHGKPYTNILWMPTFRQSKRKSLSENYIDTETGIVLFTDKNLLKEADDFLKQNNIILNLKLHRLQKSMSIYGWINDNLSNIKLLNIDLNSLYKKLHTYDALLTDYSSIYTDFMCLNKPEGFIFTDISQYEKSRGSFTYDFKSNTPGHHIYNMDDFKLFCMDVKSGVDKFQHQRQEIIPRFFKYYDGNSSQRFLDFIDNLFRI